MADGAGAANCCVLRISHLQLLIWEIEIDMAHTNKSSLGF